MGNSEGNRKGGTMIRLRKTNKVTLAAKGTSTLEYLSGMVDKTDTLSLVCRDGYWHVSIQSNGIRLVKFPLQSQARVYMGYMLEHASEILTSLPLDQNAATKEANSKNLIHFHSAAKALALKVTR